MIHVFEGDRPEVAANGIAVANTDANSIGRTKVEANGVTVANTDPNDIGRPEVATMNTITATSAVGQLRIRVLFFI